MDLEPALHAHQRREQADRAGAGDQQPPRLPGVEPPADALDVIPGLGDDARRLQQHAELAERRIDLDRVTRLDAKPLGAEAVQALDAALGVAAVAAHVPFAGGAGRAGHRIGPPHDADDVVAGGEAAAGRRLDHLAVGFMAEHQPLAAGRRLAVGAGDDFAVGAADAERQRAHQHRAIDSGGSGMSSSCAELGTPGRSVIARNCKPFDGQSLKSVADQMLRRPVRLTLGGRKSSRRPGGRRMAQAVPR